MKTRLLPCIYCLVGAASPVLAQNEIKTHYEEKILPEGNYTVTVQLGHPTEAATTWVKAEMRQLMLEAVATQPGEFATESFTVNIRGPKIEGDTRNVGLKPREAGALRWDDRLSLEFLGVHPAPKTLDIQPAPDAITVFLAGDSTVTDQGAEPWAGWGQMLPAFFRAGVAVANHAESGLSGPSFLGQRRLDKILSQMKQGDYLFIQFGHNDQKENDEDAGPFKRYKRTLEGYVDRVRERGGLPVLVTPVERRRFDRNGGPYPTLADHAEAVRQTAKEKNVPVIDLNAMSLKLYAALGANASAKAFVHYPANTFPNQSKALKDNTHHNTYGAYELAKCMVEGIKTEVPELAKHLRPGRPAFDPAQPDAPESLTIPPSARREVQKPDGD